MDASRQDNHRKPAVQLKQRSNSYIGKTNIFDDTGSENHFQTPNRNSFGEKHRSLAPEMDSAQSHRRDRMNKVDKLSVLK